MRLLLLACCVLLEAVLGYDIEQVSSWVLNPKDQVALSLYQLFGTNRYYTLRYFIDSNATKISSRDPVLTKEFLPNCRGLNSLANDNPTDPNSVLMICKDNEVHELVINPATGRFTDTKHLASFPDQNCLELEYLKSLNLVGVFCFKRSEGSNGFYYLHTIDRNTNKVSGETKLDIASINSVRFEQRTRVKATMVTKGAMKSQEVFFIFDEPFSDTSHVLITKGNSFVFIVDIDTTTRKPEKFHTLHVGKQSLVSEAGPIKFLSHEISGDKLYSAFFNIQSKIQLVSCDIDTSKPDAQLANCKTIGQNINMAYGTLSIIRTGLVAIFHKADMKFSVCAMNFAATTDAVTNCRFFEGRNETDLDAFRIESYNSTAVYIYYINSKFTKSLGIDKIELTATTAKVIDRFEAFVDYSEAVGSRYVVSMDTFIKVFDKDRTAEMILESSLLYDNRNFKLYITQDHVGVKTYKEMIGFRCANFFGTIEKRSSFPKLVGFLGKTYRIPLGRSYFAGNGVRFGINMTGVLATVSNADKARIELENNLYEYVNSFFYSYGYQVLMVKEEKIFIVRCYKKIDAETILSCKSQGLLEIDLLAESKETVVDIFETQQLMVIVTNRGIRRFDKVHGGDRSYIPMNTTIFSCSFKVKDSLLIIAVIMNNTASASPFIQLFQTNLFDVTSLALGSNITSYQAAAAQETGGDYCPKSAKFDVDDSAILIILNACPTKDRRIIRFNVADVLKPVQLSNVFLRVPQFNRENLIMCPDLQVMIIAAPGTNTALGLGYTSQNTIEDLGLSDLHASDIKKLVCLGDQAFAIGFYNSTGVFKIATYYIGALNLGNNRLHSILEFPNLGTYRDFTGSHGSGHVFYNVYNTEGTNFLRSVNLNGPELYVRSDNRRAIFDSQLLTSNLARAENFILELNFIAQKTGVSISSKTKKVKIADAEYDLDQNCLFDGPVFDFEFNQPKIASIMPRVSEPKEYLDSGIVSTYKIVYVTAADNIGPVSFVLSQAGDSSYVVIRDSSLMEESPTVLKLAERCNKISVLSSASNYMIFLSCMKNSEWRFYIYQVTQAKKTLVNKRYSNVTRRTRTMCVEKMQQNNYFILATIDEKNRMDIYSIDIGTVVDNEGKVPFYKKFNVTEGKLGSGSSARASDHDSDANQHHLLRREEHQGDAHGVEPDRRKRGQAGLHGAGHHGRHLDVCFRVRAGARHGQDQLSLRIQRSARLQNHVPRR